MITLTTLSASSIRPLEFTARSFRIPGSGRSADVAAAFEDRLKITPEFALIGGIRVDDYTITGNGIDFDGSIPFAPFTQTWRPVSYRAAYTYEPIPNLMFYSMYATSYDPAAADVFSVNPNSSLALTSAQIYETGVKQLFWDNRAEWTFAAYDITRRNVYVQVGPDDVRSCRRNRHQGGRNRRRGASDRRLETLGQRCPDRGALREFRSVDGL